jgi:peroxiredoxin
MSGDFAELPPDLPAPTDDGAADYLPGQRVPALRLPSTTGVEVDVAELAAELAVIYFYPRTGKPGVPSPHGWDDIPGARGCTPQSCSYRDHLVEFERLGAAVAGISAQSEEDQREFAFREQVTFPLLSDPDLKLAELLDLPTFEVEGMTLYKRLTLIAARGEIAKCFYPVFPPDRDAAEALAWLSGHDVAGA